MGGAAKPGDETLDLVDYVKLFSLLRDIIIRNCITFLTYLTRFISRKYLSCPTPVFPMYISTSCLSDLHFSTRLHYLLSISKFQHSTYHQIFLVNWTNLHHSFKLLNMLDRQQKTGVDEIKHLNILQYCIC